MLNVLTKKLENRNGININLITGKNETNIANIYKYGGEVGSVIIATQIAGRGVDIRLSKEAKNNGGLALLGFERAWDMRHDKQFLGRAGRQGDPYTSQFVATLEGKLLKTFSGEKIQKLMNTLGLQEGEMIQHSFISNSIVRAQNKVREHEFIKRRHRDFQISTDKENYANIKNWFNNLNIENDNDEFLPKSFISFVIEHFIRYNLSNLIHKNLTKKQAVDLVNVLNRNIGKTNTINSISIEAKEEDYVYKCIQNCK